jgi:hypothetical protein
MSTYDHSPADSAAVVTPSDTEDLDFASRALWVGTAGDLTVDLLESGTAVLFANITVGWHPLRVTRVYDTGTDADDIVAVW